MVSSRLPDANVRPSGENATLLTKWVWPRNGSPSASCVATSHRRMVSSELPDANVRPSGENATLLTASVWPRNGSPSRVGGSVVIPHKRISPWMQSLSSSRSPHDADASIVPSGLNATLNTLDECSRSVVLRCGDTCSPSSKALLLSTVLVTVSACTASSRASSMSCSWLFTERAASWRERAMLLCATASWARSTALASAVARACASCSASARTVSAICCCWLARSRSSSASVRALEATQAAPAAISANMNATTAAIPTIR